MGRSFIYIAALSWQFFVILCAIVSAQEVSKQSFVITDVRLAVTTSDSVDPIRKLNERIAYPSSLDKLIELSQGDNLKMIFNVHNKETQKGVQPHQSMLILSSKQTGDQIPIIVTVREGGKARAELDMKDTTKSAPEILLSSPGNYSLNLIIGTFSHNNPINYYIGTVNIDTSYKPFIPIKYGPKPEIHHIFKPDQKLPPVIISYSFVIIVLSPWLFLIGAWIHLGVNISFLTSEPGSLPVITIFLCTLLAIEILFYNYWIHFNIFQTLSWLSVLSILALFSGKKALSDVQEWRLKGLR